MDDLTYSHLPTLSLTATAAHPTLPITRFVLLDATVEKRLAAAMGLPIGISVLAVLDDGKDVPGMEGLINYILEHVNPVEVPWLKEATEAKWLGTKVTTQ